MKLKAILTDVYIRGWGSGWQRVIFVPSEHNLAILINSEELCVQENWTMSLNEDCIFIEDLEIPDLLVKRLLAAEKKIHAAKKQKKPFQRIFSKLLGKPIVTTKDHIRESDASKIQRYLAEGHLSENKP